jgi:hypothetical protein
VSSSHIVKHFADASVRLDLDQALPFIRSGSAAFADGRLGIALQPDATFTAKGGYATVTWLDGNFSRSWNVVFPWNGGAIKVPAMPPSLLPNQPNGAVGLSVGGVIDATNIDGYRGFRQAIPTLRVTTPPPAGHTAKFTIFAPQQV